MRKNRSISFLAALACLGSVSFKDAVAAEISVEPLEDTETSVIVVSGPIESGDEDLFRRISIEHDEAIVLLGSPGGELTAALSIGRAIRLREYTTVVTKDSVCASACALIWLAGSRRLLSPAGKVGFHASYYQEDGKLIETGVGNAVVGHYLSQLNLPEKAVIFATSASPESITWLNDSASSGIHFEVFPDVETRETAPTQALGSLDHIFTMTNPYQCEMSERMLSVFKGLVRMDQTTWQASQGAPIRLPGADRSITPTFSRNRESGAGYDAREVLATLPVSATWMGLRVNEIQYSFFEQSSNYQYRVIFSETPTNVLKVLNKYGFRLKGIDIPNQFHPEATASYGVVLNSMGDESALVCGSKMFY